MGALKGQMLFWLSTPRKIRRPIWLTRAVHRMGDKEQLSDRCYPNYLLRLPVLLESLVDPSHRWVETNCRLDGLVQGLPDEIVSAGWGCRLCF